MNVLEGKVVVIAGGAGLLGSNFVKGIVNNGGIAVIAEINAEIGLKRRDEIRAELNSNNIVFHELNINNKESVVKLIEDIHAEFGRIDGLVNSAYPKNKNYGRLFEDIAYEDFSEMMTLHIAGYFLTMQQFSIYFTKQGYGNIVNMSSIYGVIPPKFEIYKDVSFSNPLEYAAIKAALVHMSKFITKYLKGKNIRINCISPGGIYDRQPEAFTSKYNELCLNKGMLLPEDITGTLIFLLSDDSKYINGQNIIVDDGFTL
jgi:NAD(P)-dependent dehydrogenase (short-subunit alcohol dehydrogenase family)